MKKNYVLAALMLLCCLSAKAGGILTNTNQSIAFMRMMARGATMEVDGAYTNPAGLVFLPHNGFFFSGNVQTAFQNRDIDAYFVLFPETDHRKLYKGKATAPFVPSLYGAYKKDNWTFSGYFAIIAGGGKAKYDQGVPMFESKVMAGLAANSTLQGLAALTGAGAVSDLYNISSSMQGRLYVFGFQLGAAYKFADWVSGYAGLRINYALGGYKGYVQATLSESLLQNATLQAMLQANPALQQLATQSLVDLRLDCSQKGWGLTPVLGADFHFNRLNIGMKYEFLTKIDLKTTTKENSDPDGALAAYKDGVKTPSDIPAMLAVAAQYEILPTLRAAVEYHHFYDKSASMSGDRQKALKGGTDEYLCGVEWDVWKNITVSAGYQKTDYGLTDNFQTDTSFSCDSYTIGLGGAIKLSPKMKLNAGYFWTTYSDYKAALTENYNGTGLAGQNTYSRTNRVLGVGIDVAF